MREKDPRQEKGYKIKDEIKRQAIIYLEMEAYLNYTSNYYTTLSKAYEEVEKYDKMSTNKVYANFALPNESLQQTHDRLIKQNMALCRDVCDNNKSLSQNFEDDILASPLIAKEQVNSATPQNVTQKNM